MGGAVACIKCLLERLQPPSPFNYDADAIILCISFFIMFNDGFSRLDSVGVGRRLVGVVSVITQLEFEKKTRSINGKIRF